MYVQGSLRGSGGRGHDDRWHLIDGEKDGSFACTMRERETHRPVRHCRFSCSGDEGGLITNLFILSVAGIGNIWRLEVDSPLDSQGARAGTAQGAW